MTATPIKAMYVRDPDDLGAIITIPRYDGLTGRLDAVTQTFRMVFLTIDGFEHVVGKEERVLFDQVSEARIAADADRRFQWFEGRAMQGQARMFRRLRHWEGGRLGFDTTSIAGNGSEVDA